VHEDRVYLRHILDAIERIERYVQGVEQEKFEAEELLQDGVIRQLEIIGEAAKRVSSDLKALYSEVPWLAVWRRCSVANNASGKTRRAADAIVGQGVEEEARRRRKEEEEMARTNDFGAAKALAEPSQASWAASHLEEQGALKIGRGFGLRLRRCEA